MKTMEHATQDNLNVNVVPFGDKLAAISDEAGYMVVDPDTLATVGKYKFNDTDSGFFDIMTCAHPSKLPAEKLAYNYVVKIFGSFPHNITDLHKYIVYSLDDTQVCTACCSLPCLPCSTCSLPRGPVCPELTPWTTTHSPSPSSARCLRRSPSIRYTNTLSLSLSLFLSISLSLRLS
jgi:hypothetical protein